MRLMLVSRSSLEKPSPFDRLVRTSSPSKTSTFTPRTVNSAAKRAANVVLPAPDNPVNHTVNPLLLFISLLCPQVVIIGRNHWSDSLVIYHLTFLICYLEAYVFTQFAIVRSNTFS